MLAPLSAQAQAPKGKLVLYTSQPERDAAQTTAAFKQAYPGVEVEVFRSGTTEVMGKLAAEFAAGAPKADVLLIADAASMEALKKDVPAASVSGSEGRQARGGRVRRRSHLFRLKLITTGIAVNTAGQEPSRLPGPIWPSRKTRARSRCRARFIPGAAAIMLGTMTARPDLGWAFFEQLKADEAVAVRGNGGGADCRREWRKALRRAGRLHGVQRQGEGLADRLHFPAEGDARGDRAGGDVEDDAESAAARAFIDFILSDEGQKLALSMGYIPAKASVGTPSWLSARNGHQADADRYRQRGAEQQRQSEAFCRAVR